MALGLVNKAKVLSTAEKYVQQGKLQNAIAEYEKVLKLDPKDLTILNTIGDLYSRSGKSVEAVNCFRKIGDAYATAGFTVKAIAMYKKLTKLSPHNIDALLRLADLYSQQGLYSDARAQYVVLADQYMKGGNHSEAAGIFKKLLELDPENTSMQTRLADLYIKLGNQTDAKDIFMQAAQALYAKASLQEANQALDRVLKIDANFMPALVLRAQIAGESGDPEKTIDSLAKIPDIDSRPDALNTLLQAMLKSGRLGDAEQIVSKLLNLHNDIGGIKPYTEALFHAGRFQDALQLYELYSDQLFASNPQEILQSLHNNLGRGKGDPAALERALNLFRKAGENTYINEVLELLAQAYVQAGNLEKATALYQELINLEPENSQHEQSLKQLSARMGTEPIARELTVEQKSQAFMVEELQHSAPVIETNYPAEIAETVRAALTDSELFTSYNLHEKAIAPLEAALPVAPQDPQLHQQLATLYVHSGRFQDAANSCKLLSRLYAHAGFQADADQYAAMASKYEDMAGEQPAMAPPLASISTPGVEVEVKARETAAPTFTASSIAEFSFENVPAAKAEPDEIAPIQQAPPVAMPLEAAPPVPQAQEFSVTPTAPPAAVVQAGAPETTHEIDLSGEWEDMLVVEGSPAQPAEAATAHMQPPMPNVNQAFEETVAEARFYIDQAMVSEAQEAIARLNSLAAGHPVIQELRSALNSATAAKSNMAAAASASTPAFNPQQTAPPTPGNVGTYREEQPILDLDSDFSQVFEIAPAPLPAPPPVAPPQVFQAAAPVAPAPLSKPAEPATSNPLGDLVLDLENALEGEFGEPHVAAAAPASVAPPRPPARVEQTRVAAASPSKPAPLNDTDTLSVLSDLFKEFKDEVEEEGASTEDPETHYNLGVAFKEMGLLDEAIGELQKVCHAVSQGHTFPQALQAYTWLAHCLMEKGAPQAAVRWYESALTIHGIGEESRLAVYYDLASAHEAAGNRKAALKDLMEVYGSNIDYRDVAERIKGLRA